MNTNEAQKMRPDEAAFMTALVVIELFILPLIGDHLGKYGGGLAMAGVALIGIIAYLVFFGQRLRNRGQTKSFVGVPAASFAVSLILVLAYGLFRSH
ncbi:MAG TPA: hypothetical protein VFE51_06015 [Verrucomicrobiae bacterium]|nr:hypothetical protein [Verrucomicrobiae bacterium]